jgi:hypothetical protein
MNSDELSHFTSFLELDVRHQQSKGWAFKHFKSLTAELQEGRDFLWFHQLDDADLITTLRQQGRIYASTANLVMLSPSGVKKFEQALS